MKKTRMFATMMVLMLSLSAEGKTPITVITNDGAIENTGTVFSFDQTSGKLTQKKVLKTAGSTSGGFASATTVVTGGNCVFLIDSGSNDIAAFTGPAGGYAKVGNFSSSNTLFNPDGGALAISKDGKALYSANSASRNLSWWKINSSCSLTHERDYIPHGGPDFFGPGLAVSPNGKVLLISSPDNGYVETFGINASHSLTDKGPTYFNTFSQCSAGCFPAAIAFTGDGKAIAVGNSSVAPPIMFVADISSAAVISNPAVISLTSSPQLYIPAVPVFDSTCRTNQKCNLYLGMGGFGSSYPGGVTVIAFDKSDISNAKVRSVKPNTKSETYGIIGQLAHWIVQAGSNAPADLTAFPINYSTGKLGEGVNSLDHQSSSLASFAAF